MRYFKFLFLCISSLLFTVNGKAQENLLLKKWQVNSVNVTSVIPGNPKFKPIEYNAAIDSGFIIPAFDQIEFLKNDSCKILVDNKKIQASYKITNKTITICYGSTNRKFKYAIKDDVLIFDEIFPLKSNRRQIIGYNTNIICKNFNL